MIVGSSMRCPARLTRFVQRHADYNRPELISNTPCEDMKGKGSVGSHRASLSSRQNLAGETLKRDDVNVTRRVTSTEL